LGQFRYKQSPDWVKQNTYCSGEIFMLTEAVFV